MQAEGRVVEIFTEHAGDFLAGAQVIGDMIITLHDTSDFSEEGGQVIIDGTVYDYTTVDDVANTMFLSSGLIAGTVAQGVGADDPITEGIPVDLYPIADEKLAMITQADDGSEAVELIEAVLEHGFKTMFDDQRWDDGQGPYVTIDDEQGRWYVTKVHGYEAQILTSTLTGPLDLANHTDGIAPTLAPVVTIVAGVVNSVFLKMDAYVNQDLFKFKIYKSTINGFIPAEGDVYVEDRASLVQVSGLTAGTPYYFRVSVTDDDGEGPLSAQQTATPFKIDTAGMAQSVIDSIDSAGARADAAQLDADNANAAAIAASAAANTAQSTADGAIRTWYQSGAPAGLNNTTDLGDLWFDTDDGQAYRWNGTTWAIIEDNSIAAALAAASAAQTTADNAATAASTAQTTANGKNKVIHSGASASTPASYQLNDTWFKYLGGVVVGMWRHDGTAWVTQKIDGLTIANIDAATITTGFLNVSALIQAGAIATDKLAAKVILADAVYSQAGYFGTLTFDQLTGGTINSTVLLSGDMWTALSGARAGMSKANGIQVFGSDGEAILDVPLIPDANGDLIALLRANLIARSLTVEDFLSLRGVNNEFSKGSVTTLAVGVTPPTSPLQVTFSWPSKPPGLASSFGYGPGGLHKSGSIWYTTDNFYGGGVNRYTEGATSFDAYGTNYFINMGSNWHPNGCVVIGAYLYILATDDTRTTGGWYSWYVRKHDAATGAYISEWQYQPAGATTGAYSGNAPQIGYKGANILIAQGAITGGVEIREYTIAGAQVGSTITCDGGGGRNCQAILYGNFDFGSARYVAALENLEGTTGALVGVYNATGVGQPNEFFPLPFSSNVRGLEWDGSVFRSMNMTTIYKHTNFAWVVALGGARQAVYSWYDSNATGGQHETLVSAVVGFTLVKRAAFTITTPPIPPSAGGTDDVTGVRIYHHAGNVYTYPSGFLREAADLADGVRTVTYYSAPVLVTAANTGVPAAFPNSAPAILKSTTGGFIVTGDGSGEWPGMVQDAANRKQAVAQTFTTATLNTITDLATLIDADTGVTYSAGTLTVSKAGLYVITGSVTFATNGNGARYAEITSSIDGVLQSNNAQANASISQRTSVGWTGRLSAGEAVYLRAYQSSGGNLATLVGETHLSLTRISA